MPLFGCPGPSRLVPLVGFLWLVSLAGQIGGSPLAASISTVYFICSVIATTKANNLAVAGVLRRCGVLPCGWRGPQERWKE